MSEQEVIEAIKYMQKYQTETDKLEAKTAEIRIGESDGDEESKLART